MRCVVTGAAGFIGSHLCTALLAAGHEVAGVDAYIPYYPRAAKERNLVHARRDPRFTFHEIDLRAEDAAPLVAVLQGAETVFHLAAMGGLLASWTAFDGYMTCNVQATQRLLEAIRLAGGVRRLVHASTSSVYGDYVIGPETTTPRPVSPYGITKLAAEHLVQTYDRQFDVPATILRLFSVYGPHQRPDMGYYQFVERLLSDRPITIFGDGTQRRGNTYVGDIVRAFMLADQRFERGAVYNVGGAEEVSANEVLAILEELTGRHARRVHGPDRPGEQRRALADTTLARERLGFTPQTPLRQGLQAQVEWQRALADSQSGPERALPRMDAAQPAAEQAVTASA